MSPAAAPSDPERPLHEGGAFDAATSTPAESRAAAAAAAVDLAFLVPTRNRAERLARTLARLGRLPSSDTVADSARPLHWEVVIVDNASDDPARVRSAAPDRLENGCPVRLVRAASNLAAAARNLGAEHTHARLICMLDDDSWPADGRVLTIAAAWLRALDGDRNPGGSEHNQRPDVSALQATAGEVLRRAFAIGARITIGAPEGEPERGGLPQVFVGCGVLIRRDLLLETGGFDPSFEYYAEEYDLCARLLARGYHMHHDPDFHVVHEKDAVERDMNRILRLLVRNNGWVNQRYTPESYRAIEHDQLIARYRRIAEREGALAGFERGLQELHVSTRRPEAAPDAPLSHEAWAWFTGRKDAESHLATRLPEALSMLGERTANSARSAADRPSSLADLPTVAVVGAGRQWEVVVECLESMAATGLSGRCVAPAFRVVPPTAGDLDARDTSPLGVLDAGPLSSSLAARLRTADIVVPGTLSPGMVDLAAARLRAAINLMHGGSNGAGVPAARRGADGRPIVVEAVWPWKSTLQQTGLSTAPVGV